MGLSYPLQYFLLHVVSKWPEQGGSEDQWAIYGCRKKSARTMTWMSPDLILIPLTAVDLEYSIGATCHTQITVVTCEKYSNTEIYVYYSIYIYYSSAAPALASSGRSTEDTALPKSLSSCQGNVFCREKTKKGNLMQAGAGERTERREGGVMKQWVQKCSAYIEGLAGLCTPFFATHGSVWSLEGQEEPEQGPPPMFPTPLTPSLLDHGSSRWTRYYRYYCS